LAVKANFFSLIYPGVESDIQREARKIFWRKKLMANYGLLRSYRFTDAAEDIRGSKLYGLNDEKLGKIDDVIFDYSTGVIRYLVVDTGGWLTTKKFIVPAERVRASAKHADDFAVDLNKAQVESFPAYNESDLESDKQWSDYEGRYRSKWESDPVMHRAETDRNITPTTAQMRENLPSVRASEEETVEIEDTGFIEPGFAASTSTVEIQNNAVGIGPRWDRFQDRLRERRKEVIGSVKEGYRKAS
jgi:sporulation protein YlmC with PRC-barrel domain